MQRCRKPRVYMLYPFPCFPLSCQCYACISFCVLCARERDRDRVKPRASNPNATNRRCYDPPETMRWGAKSKMVPNGRYGGLFFWFRFKQNGMEMQNMLVQRGASPSSNV